MTGPHYLRMRNNRLSNLDDNMVPVPDSLKRALKKLDEDYPIVSHTRAGRLSSTVRRMKAEKEQGIPISCRTGRTILTTNGRRLSDLTEVEWEETFAALSTALEQSYPEMYRQTFN